MGTKTTPQEKRALKERIVAALLALDATVPDVLKVEQIWDDGSEGTHITLTWCRDYKESRYTERDLATCLEAAKDDLIMVGRLAQGLPSYVPGIVLTHVGSHGWWWDDNTHWEPNVKVTLHMWYRR